MRKGPILVIVALAGLAVGGVYAFQAMKKPPKSGLSITEIAPDSLVYYAQADELRQRWTGAKRTRAWKDLEGSSLLDTLRGSPDVQAFLAGVEELSEQVEYEINADNALKFVGKELAFGVALDPQEARFRSLLLTRLDVDALAKDLLEGRTDWRELQAELNRRTALADFELLTRDYKGYVVTTARRGENIYYAAQLEDVLAVSDSKNLLEAAVDTRIAKGAGSLARFDAFTDETESLPGDAVAYDWINVDALDGRREMITKSLNRVAPFETTRLVDTVFDGVAGAGTLARAFRLPGNDLYQLTWEWSRPAEEIFADDRSPAVFDVLPQDAALYVEGRSLGEVARAWNESKVKQDILATPLWAKFEEVLENPSDKLPSLPGAMPQFPMPDEGLDRFTLRFTSRMLSKQVEAALAGDVGLAATWTTESDDLPSFVAAVRLGTEGRFTELFLRGLHAAQVDERILTFDHDGQEFYGVTELDDEYAFYWVPLGDLVVVSNDQNMVRTAVDGAAGDGSDAPTALTQAVESFDPSYRAFAYLDVDRAAAAVEAAMGSSMTPEELRQFLDSLGLSLTPYYAAAVYVPDDFSRIEVRWEAPFADDLPPRTKEILGSMESASVGGLEAMPEDTFLYAGAFVDLSNYRELIEQQVPAELIDVLDDGIREFEDVFGMSVNDEVLPALGRELGFAIGFRPAAPSAGRPGQRELVTTVPGITFLVEVRDRAAMQRLLDRAMYLLNDEVRGSAPDAPDELIVKDEYRGNQVWRMQVPPEARGQIPKTLRPGAVFIDDYLVITSDMQVARDMLAVRAGKKSGFADSEVVQRMADAGVPAEGVQVYLVDIDGVISQIAQYAPLFAELTGSPRDIPYPQFPPDGNQRKWERRMADYQRAVSEQREKGAVKVREYLDSFRFLDFLATRTDVEDGVMTGRAVLGFTR